MTRVAIAGTGGLACSIAQCLHEETSHPFILLSRAPKPHLSQKNYQIVEVDYDDTKSLEFALKGVQVVISTVPGAVQFKLIDAALSAGVQRFAPAEFEGPSTLRPVDALDNSKKAVLNYLHQNSSRINWTSFVCGIFYERFAAGGMQASNMGFGSGIAGPGEFMINAEEMIAEVPFTNAAGRVVTLCMTSVYDVGRFVVRSLEMRTWPQELTMYGERMSVQDFILTVERVRGRSFFPNVTWHDFQTLQHQLSLARNTGDAKRYHNLLHLIAAQEGRYDYEGPVLNARYPDITPVTLRSWLEACWGRPTRPIPTIGISDIDVLGATDQRRKQLR